VNETQVQEEEPLQTVPQYTNFDDITGKVSEKDNFDGDVEIVTGDADVVAAVTNNANTNTYDGAGKGDETIAVIDKNGADSDNAIEVVKAKDELLLQNNELYLDNKIDADAISGKNTIKDNLGGSSTIKTGDASATVNVFNFGNSNFANVGLAEFDVFDDSAGDIYLDTLSYGTAKELHIDQNGADSSNAITLGSDKTQLIFQDNFAEVNNDINIEVNTGDNTITQSLGDAVIETGDASVIANIVNFLNTNFVGLGNLLVGVVNIWDGYTGDVYLPTLAGLDANATIAKNGAGSQNETTISDTNSLELYQQNEVAINNTINIDANTGDNNVSKNVGDSINIKTGDIDTAINSTTIAGQNFYHQGGLINLIFLNKNGVITPYYVNEAGNLVEVPQIYADTTENGAYSENVTAVSTTDSKVVSQKNTAIVNNNLNIDVNTGDNSITKNVDSSASVKTGDVSVLASVSNFIGNNFFGDNLVITFINDLGDWSGNLLPGWMKGNKDGNKDEHAGIGGPATTEETVAQTENDKETAQSTNETNEKSIAATHATEDTGNGDTSTDNGVTAGLSLNGFTGFVSTGFGFQGNELTTTIDEGEEALVAGVTETTDTRPVYRPTISTEGATKGLFNIEDISPFSVLAVAGLIVVANFEIKRRFNLA